MHKSLTICLALALAGCVAPTATSDQRIACLNTPSCSNQLDPISQSGTAYLPPSH